MYAIQYIKYIFGTFLNCRIYLEISATYKNVWMSYMNVMNEIQYIKIKFWVPTHKQTFQAKHFTKGEEFKNNNAKPFV